MIEGHELNLIWKQSLLMEFLNKTKVNLDLKYKIEN